MTDRFANGDPSNDLGGLTGEPADAPASTRPTRASTTAATSTGLTSKLDYIKGLGTTAIWLTPSFNNKPVQGTGGQESAGYHGYWITDFTHIDPHLGTNDDLQDADRRGAHEGHEGLLRHHHQPHRRRHRLHRGRSTPTVYKTDSPYTDADRHTLRRHAYAETRPTSRRWTPTRFPYTPFFHTAGDATAKMPAWLNDPTMYHNRGDSTFAGESAEYGDFVGLDDLFTEQPRRRAGHGGHLQGVGRPRHRRVPHRHRQARQRRVLAAVRAGDARPGRRSATPTSSCSARSTTATRRSSRIYSTDGQAARHARLRLPGRRPSLCPTARADDDLRELYAGDDYYTDTDSNAYELPTFLGNHDMGRVGVPLKGSSSATRPHGQGAVRQRADVPHPRPAGRLLRRRAGLHRRRRRQGRPPGHVREPGRRSTTTTPMLGRADRADGPVRPDGAALPDDRGPVAPAGSRTRRWPTAPRSPATPATAPASSP